MSQQSVFHASNASNASNAFLSLVSSDSEDEPKPKVMALNPNATAFKSSRPDVKSIQPAVKSVREDDWEEVRITAKKVVNKVKGKTYDKKTYDKKPNQKGSYKGNGKKSEATATHDKKARVTVHSLIEKLVSGINIDDIANDFKFAIDAEDGHYAKGKLLEIATSYLFHEVLSHELIKPYFFENNVREGDGHTALFWVAWSEYFKYSERYENDFENGTIASNPLAGFRRELSDALATIDLLLDVGYTPTTKNRHNETVVGSLEVAHGEGRIPIEWYEPIKSKYLALTPKSAEVTLREICSKVSTAQEVLDKYKTLYCFGFMIAPDFASKLALEFCMKLTPSCIGKGAFWNPVKEKLDMFRGMIQSFDFVMQSQNPPQDYKDFRSAFVGWKSKNQLKLFNQLLSQYTLETIANVEQEHANKLLNPSQTEWRYETCFSDPLAGVLGECAGNADKKAYVMKKLSSPESFHLALYCISHGKFIDTEMALSIANICETPEFDANLRLKFALYDVIEKLYGQKIKNITQCINFFKTHSFSTSAVKSVVDVSISASIRVAEEFLQLDETHCESLKESSQRILTNVTTICEYVDKLRELVRNPSVKQQSVIESFVARAYYDVYNDSRLEKFTELVKCCKEMFIFSPTDVRHVIAKMNKIELGDFFESSKLENVRCVLATL